MLVAWRREHWRVGDIDGQGAVEAVEAGAEAGAVGAELAQLDPIAFAHIGGQQEWSRHPVGAVAGRPEQRVFAQRPRISRFPIGPDASRRETEAGPSGIAQAAIDAIIDVERIAAPQLHLYDY